MNENTKLKEYFSNEGMYHEIIEETRPDNTYMRRDGYSSLSITEKQTLCSMLVQRKDA